MALARVMQRRPTHNDNGTFHDFLSRLVTEKGADRRMGLLYYWQVNEAGVKKRAEICKEGNRCGITNDTVSNLDCSLHEKRSG